MRMCSFMMAGGGGRRVHINPEQVVCLVDMGEDRTQVVTTGLSGATSMTLIVEGGHDEVSRVLQGRGDAARPNLADIMDMPLPGETPLS
jgi:hypothetical protein